MGRGAARRRPGARAACCARNGAEMDVRGRDASTAAPTGSTGCRTAASRWSTTRPASRRPGAQVEAGYALQLGMLGLMAERGGFEGVGGEPTRFEYWSLGRATTSDTGFGYVTTPILEGRKHERASRASEFLPQTRALSRRRARPLDPRQRAVHRAAQSRRAAATPTYDQLMRLDEWLGRERQATMSGRGSFRCTDSQAHAVAPERSVWLSASAGTGKTQVLSRAGAAAAAAARRQAVADPLPDLHQGRRGRDGRAGQRGARALGAADRAELASELMRSARRSARNAGARPHAVRRGARLPRRRPADRHDPRLRAVAARRLSRRGRAGPRHPRRWRTATASCCCSQVLADLLVRRRSGSGDAAAARRARRCSACGMGADEVRGVAAALRRGARGLVRARRLAARRCATAVERLLGLPADADADSLAELCADGAVRLSTRCAAASRPTRRGAPRPGRPRPRRSRWLARRPGRAAGDARCAARRAVHRKGRRAALAQQSLEKFDADYADHARARSLHCMRRVRERRALLALADPSTPALELGRALRARLGRGQAARGADRFRRPDPPRRRAARPCRHGRVDPLQARPPLRPHPRRRGAGHQRRAVADHRRADRATSSPGAGQRGDVLRTLFVVGDYKQAIFRFQGTSPENFEQRAQRVQREMRPRRTMRRAARRSTPQLLELGLDRSFRTAQPVLDFVDAAIGDRRP